MHTISKVLIMMYLNINLVKVDMIKYDTNIHDPLAITQPLSQYRLSFTIYSTLELAPRGSELSMTDLVKSTIRSENNKRIRNKPERQKFKKGDYKDTDDNTKIESKTEDKTKNCNWELAVSKSLLIWKESERKKKTKNKKSHKKLKTTKPQKNHKKIKSKNKNEDELDSTEEGFKKIKANNNNKEAHSLNGNRSHYKIMQLNGSNANFCSKLPELECMINNFKSDVIIISEANAEITDEKKMEERSKAFPEYKFEDKQVTNNDRARCTIMLRKSIKHERLSKYEDTMNSSVAVCIKDGDSKWI